MELIRRDPEERLQFLSHIQPLLMRLPAEEVPALKQLMG